MRTQKENKTIAISAHRKLQENHRQGKDPRIHWPELDLSKVYFIQTRDAKCLLCMAPGGMLTLGNHFHGNHNTVSALIEY
jgi:hypothetical protein